MNPLTNLIEKLKYFPGIGERTATRLSYFLLSLKKEKAIEIADAIKEAKEKIKFCSVCGNYTEKDPCEICSSRKGIADTLIVVETPESIPKMLAIKDLKTHFHVLHGLLSPLEGKTAKDLNMDTLLKRLKEEPNIKEVIIALNPSIEGEATANYIKDILKDTGIKLTRLAFGLSMGTELEWVDELTLKKSLEGRSEI